MSGVVRFIAMDISPVLYKAGFTKKGGIEQRLEGQELTTRVYVLGKSTPGRGNRWCKALRGEPAW